MIGHVRGMGEIRNPAFVKAVIGRGGIAPPARGFSPRLCPVSGGTCCVCDLSTHKPDPAWKLERYFHGLPAGERACRQTGRKAYVKYISIV
jgi:hypothetical protein